MSPNNYNIAKLLSNHIKNTPLKFNEYTSNLSNRFISQIKADLTVEDIAELNIIYKFIFMYSLITSDLNAVKQIMRDPKMVVIIIKALIIDGNLKLRQNSASVDIMIKFGHKHRKTLSSNNLIMLGCFYFNPSAFHNIIKSVLQTHYNESGQIK